MTHVTAAGCNLTPNSIVFTGVASLQKYWVKL